MIYRNIDRIGWNIERKFRIYELNPTQNKKEKPNKNPNSIEKIREYLYGKPKPDLMEVGTQMTKRQEKQYKTIGQQTTDRGPKIKVIKEKPLQIQQEEILQNESKHIEEEKLKNSLKQEDVKSMLRVQNINTKSFYWDQKQEQYEKLPSIRDLYNKTNQRCKVLTGLFDLQYLQRRIC